MQNDIKGDIMLVTLIRAAILYFFIIACMRLMGKRQLGELQPTELVITILISEIITVPMQDNGVPLANSVIAVLLLVSLEIINSALCLKSAKLRSVVEGNPLIVIRNGVLCQKQLKQLRFSVEDLLEQLRLKDVFDISDVRYAIVETNGQLSVMLKPEKEPLTAETVCEVENNKDLPCLVISDGKTLSKNFRTCNMDDKKLENILKKEKITPDGIMLMQADSCGNYTIIKKEEAK